MRRRSIIAAAVVAIVLAGTAAIVLSLALGGEDPDRRIAAPTPTLPVMDGPAPQTSAAPDPEPAAAPRPSPSRQDDAQLAGQRLIAAFRGTEPPERLTRMIRQGELAGVILYGDNVSGLDGTRALVDELQAIPRPEGMDAPLLVMIDQEGGLVRRLEDAPPAASASELAATRDEAGIERAGRATGSALRRAGVNVDLAPVADVPGDGSAMAREQRTFGDTADEVGRRAAAFTRGLVHGGVQATAKHFPGFGAATENSDVAPVTIGRSRADLRAGDERSFAAVVDAGAELVMLSNAIYPALDPERPASLSPAVGRDELRDQLGFTGVSVTDDLGATALQSFGGPGRLAGRAARAGNDLLLYGQGWPDPLQAVAQAHAVLAAGLSDGGLRRERFTASVRRVQALRASAG